MKPTSSPDISQKELSQARKLMKKKALIKAEMDRLLPKAQSDALWEASCIRLSQILSAYEDMPKGERLHTHSFIFPAAAIYLTVKEKIPAGQAFSVIENAAIVNTASIGRKLTSLMKLPGLPGLFILLWDPITRKMFGERAGFQNVFYPREKGAYRMDIVSCPYVRYFTLLGCPELTRIFCENDDRTYGNLPGLCFERHTTLGKGGERCDFYLRKR